MTTLSLLSLGCQAGWDLYNSVGSVQKGLAGLNSFATLINGPGVKRIVQHKLHSLHRRVRSLARPLSFCALWAHARGSSAAEIVCEARATLHDIEEFVRVVRADRSKLADEEFMNYTLDCFHRELDHAIHNLSLCIGIANISDGKNTRPNSSDTTQRLSPSHLLRACSRLQSMCNVGGDIASSFGALYCQNFVDYDGSTVKWTTLSRSASLRLVTTSAQKRTFRLEISNEECVQSEAKLARPRKKAFSLMKFDTLSALYFRLSTFGDSQIHCDLCERDDDHRSIHMSDNVFIWVDMISNQVRCRFAFVPVQNADSVCSTDSKTAQNFNHSAIQPLTFVYLVRLCTHESSVRSSGGVPNWVHLSASDEELEMILRDPGSPDLPAHSIPTASPNTSNYVPFPVDTQGGREERSREENSGEQNSQISESSNVTILFPEKSPEEDGSPEFDFCNTLGNNDLGWPVEIIQHTSVLDLEGR
eukprot:387677_1